MDIFDLKLFVLVGFSPEEFSLSPLLLCVISVVIAFSSVDFVSLSFVPFFLYFS